MYYRRLCSILEERLRESRRFIQVLAGPRQVGKTTAIRQVLEALESPFHYASADDPLLQTHTWVEQQWESRDYEQKKMMDRRQFLYWTRSKKLRIPLEEFLLTPIRHYVEPQ